VQGVAQAKQIHSPGAYIMIVPPNLQTLKERLAGRGTETEENLNRRLNNALNELKLWHEYDYIVVNDSLTTAINDINSIITAQKCYRKEAIGDLEWLQKIK